MRYILIIFILISSYLYSLHLSKNLDDKEYQLKILIDSLCEIKRQIVLFKYDADVVFKKAFGINDKVKLMNDISSQLVFDKLTNEERKLLIDYLNNFGYGDIQIERNKCDCVIEDFQSNLKNYKIEKKGRKKLYKTLSISFALIISVLIV